MITTLPRRPFARPTLLLLALAALLAAGQLLALVPSPAPPQPISAISAPALVQRIASAPAAVDPRAIPAELRALPERAELRTATSATFQTGPASYTALVAPQPMHYRDADGAWQPIVAGFRATGSSFIADRNAIAARADLRTPAFAATAGQLAFSWRSTELGLVTDQRFVPLAHALPDGLTAAAQRDAGMRLAYAGAWSSAAIAEELISAPGSLKQQLVIAERPSAQRAELLELRVDLALAPGTALFADGTSVVGPVERAQLLELRAPGQPPLRFAPVVAFEQADRGSPVAGRYRIIPGADAQHWTLGIQTPWSWWSAPDRRYPAVLDPTMQVLTTTGADTGGLAWVANGSVPPAAKGANPDTQDTALHPGGMALGEFGGNGPYRGYLQFNDMPAALTGPLQQITGASLQVTPSNMSSPGYTYKKKSGDPWAAAVFSFPTELAWFSCNTSCPFDLSGAPGGVSWASRPAGTPIGTQTLRSPQRNDFSKTASTLFDVTAQIQQYYASWESAAPASGPLFSLQAAASCPDSSVANYTPGTVEIGAVPQCSRLLIAPADIQLRLSYTTRPMSTAPFALSNILNTGGVPSFQEGVFSLTQHSYSLAATGNSSWRAVAVRGNHAENQPPSTPSTSVGLKLNGPGGLQVETASADPARPGFLLIDGHSGQIASSTALGVSVQPSAANDFASDRQRNYRVVYTEASSESVVVGTQATFQCGISSLDLIGLCEFDVPQPDLSIGITVNTPDSTDVDFALIVPSEATTAQQAVLTADSQQVVRQFGPAGAVTRSMVLAPAPKSGTYALAVTNNGLPQNVDPTRPGAATFFMIQVTLLICPKNSIPTARYGCQTIYHPESTDPPTFTRAATGLGVSVYSVGGFADSGASLACPGALWSTAGESGSAPLILSSASGQKRHTYVAQGRVCYFPTGSPGGRRLITTSDSGIGLTLPNASAPSFGLQGGQIFGDSMTIPSGTEPNGVVVLDATALGRIHGIAGTRRNLAPFKQNWAGRYSQPGVQEAIDPYDMTVISPNVFDIRYSADGGQTVKTADWQLSWTYYPDLTFSGTSLEDHFSMTTLQNPGAPIADAGQEYLSFAGMQLRLLDSGVGYFADADAFDVRVGNGFPVVDQLRGAASITASDGMGGASRTLQAVIQPPGRPRLPGDQSGQRPCVAADGAQLSCLDLRTPTYDYANGAGEQQVKRWSLPDLHIAGSAAAVQVSTDGQLSVYGEPGASPQALSQSFSFDSWNADVSVSEGPCPGSVDQTPVSITSGVGMIALPMLESGVEMRFRLCRTTLNEVKLTLEVPKPGIPVGSTGIGISLIGGEVTIGPDDTQIVASIEFQSTDQALLTGGKGTVTLSTAGIFSLQASAKLVGVLDADMKLAVSWSPLDVLVESKVSGYGGIITGALRMHAWVGKGWQNKYPWLQDGKFYFTGSIDSSVQIPKGMVIDKWYFKLPPSTISLGSVTIQFGQFCQNSGCSASGWGMSARLTILGFGVGLYVDSGGLDLFLGSGGHTLVDQYGGAPGAVAAAPSDVPTIVQAGGYQPLLAPQIHSVFDDAPVSSAASVCSRVGATHTCPFTVPTGTGRALFGVSWQRPGLQISLVAPDGSRSTRNAPQPGVLLDGSGGASSQLSFAVAPVGAASTIQPGVWKIVLDNVVEIASDRPSSTNYSLLFAADPPAAKVRFTAPTIIGKSPDSGGLLTVSWQVTRGGGPLDGTLPYELVARPTRQDADGENIFSGVPLGNPSQSGQLLTGASGSFVWDTRSLASGEYRIGIRLDDHASGNAGVVDWSVGTVAIDDASAPEAPQLLDTVYSGDDDVFLTWKANTELDLAGYLVRYRVLNYAGSAPIATSWDRRITPSGDAALRALGVERARITGFAPGQGGRICIAAYDASGNIGPCARASVSVPTRPSPELDAPQLTRVGRDLVAWSAPSSVAVAGYLVTIAPRGYLRQGVEAAPRTFDVGAATQYVPSGLAAGQAYRIEVRGYTATKFVGPAASGAIPSGESYAAWVAAFGVSGDGALESADIDLDGLSNLEEFAFGSFPTTADSDGDGFDDGEARLWARKAEYARPLYHAVPRLTLLGAAAIELTSATNRPISGAEELLPLNGGAGELRWTASGDAAWLKVVSSGGGGDALTIFADASGLAPGFYTGRITIQTQGGTANTAAIAPAQTVSIPVTLSVTGKVWREISLPLISSR